MGKDEELILSFKKDVPPIVSSDGITLYLPDTVENWEKSEKLVTWGELFRFDEILDTETTTPRYAVAVLNLVRTKEFEEFQESVEDKIVAIILKRFSSYYGCSHNNADHIGPTGEGVSWADSRIKELEGLVVDTMDFAIEGWSYASEYFKDKWDYEGELERLRGRLHKAGKEG